MSIRDFFKNQEIFITGGSGFLGKALIEKLMRSCYDFSKIYVLLRDKKGKSCQERLACILETKLFDRARREQPESFKRIEAIAGDCAVLRLGLSDEDLKKLKNVSIVFHSAASVRFDDPLKDAVLLNTRGTLEVLKIAESLTKLKAFAHVSTTYCNSETVIEEKVYKSCADWRETIRLAEALDSDTLDVFNLKYNDFKPNTYTFTKALAEDIVDDYKHKLPVFIYRPSIVVNCLDDPIPGWVDNFNGPIGMLIGCGIGILRTHDNNGKKIQAIVPVDIVIRGLIIATFKKGIETARKNTFFSYGPKSDTDELEVYNCAIDSISPISTCDLTEMGRLRILENPFERTLWMPGGGYTNCPVVFYFKYFFVQILMAIVFDLFLRLCGKKPMLLKIQRRFRYAINAISIFIKTEWHFRAEKFFDLESVVPKDEYYDFAFLEKSHINFMDFVEQSIRGGKEFLLKESPESSPEARKRLKLLKALNYGINSVLYLLFGRLIFNFLYKKLQEFY